MRAYVAVGTNLGDRWANLGLAARALAAAPRVAVVRASRVWETAPLGPPQPRYLNAVLELDTLLPPRRLLEALQAIEARARRQRGLRWGPRTLDLDLLLHQGTGDAPHAEHGLVLPHPGLAERRFVLEPLAELAPDLVVPGLGRTVAALRSAAPPWDVAPVGRYPR